MTRYSDEFQTKEQALDDARASAAISHHLENERQSLKRQLAAANAEIERLRAELEAATRRAKLPHPELAYKAIMARSEQLKEDHPHA